MDVGKHHARTSLANVRVHIIYNVDAETSPKLNLRATLETKSSFHHRRMISYFKGKYAIWTQLLRSFYRQRRTPIIVQLPFAQNLCTHRPTKFDAR